MDYVSGDTVDLGTEQESYSTSSVLSPDECDTFAYSQLRNDLKNRGYINKTVSKEVSLEWKVHANRSEHTAPKSGPVLTSSGDIILADDTGRVRSFDSDRLLNWETSITDHHRGSHGTPIICNSRAYIPDYSGNVTSLHLDSGEIEWQVEVADHIGASLSYYDGLLYVAGEHNVSNNGGSIRAINAKTGYEVWSDRTPILHTHTAVTVDTDTDSLLLGDNYGQAYSYSLSDLSLNWTYEAGGDVKAPIPVSDGNAYIPSWSGHFACVDVVSGDHIWEFDTGSKVMGSPAVVDGVVYFGAHNGYLYALDSQSGSLNWSTKTSGKIIGGVVATDDHVLAGSYDSNLYCFDRETGDVVWSFECKGRVTGEPLVTDNAIYITERAKNGNSAMPGCLYKLTN